MITGGGGFALLGLAVLVEFSISQDDFQPCSMNIAIDNPRAVGNSWLPSSDATRDEWERIEQAERINLQQMKRYEERIESHRGLGEWVE